jgi:hypothetical protein
MLDSYAVQNQGVNEKRYDFKVIAFLRSIGIIVWDEHRTFNCD